MRKCAEAKEEKNATKARTSTLREAKYTYTKRTDLSLEENTSIPEGF